MKYNFTATHGVEFGEPDKDGAYAAWAHFEHDRSLDTPAGVLVYTFATDDKKVADRLRGVKEYGIAEASAKPEPEPEPEPAS